MKILARVKLLARLKMRFAMVQITLYDVQVIVLDHLTLLFVETEGVFSSGLSLRLIFPTA